MSTPKTDALPLGDAPRLESYNLQDHFININSENLRKSGDTIFLDIWRSGEFKTIPLQLKNYK